MEGAVEVEDVRSVGFALVMLLFAAACGGKRSAPAESISSERPASGTYDWPAAQSAAVLRVLGGLFNNSPGSPSTFAMYYGAEMSARGAAGVGKDALARLVAFGSAVGDVIVAWSAADQFDWTRGETFKIPVTVDTSGMQADRGMTTTTTSIGGRGMTTAAGIDLRLRRWHARR